MTMITPSYLGETIEYSSLHACRSTLEDPTREVLRFFRFYARCKGVLNIWRGRPGRNACEGWCEAGAAIARARPRDATWLGPQVEF